MNPSPPNSKAIAVSRKQLIVLGAVLVALAGVVALWHHVSRNPPAWLVQWEIHRFLKKETHTSKFETDFAFPSVEAMNKVPTAVAGKGALAKGPRTGKSFEALAVEYLMLKENTLILERTVPGSAVELTNAQHRLERLTQQLDKAQTAGSTNLQVLQAQLGALRNRISLLESNVALEPQLQRQQTELVPITADLWEFQRQWDEELQALVASGANQLAEARDQLLARMAREFNRAASYDAIYQLIAQELWVAERLLGSANPAHRRIGLGLALEAGRRSLDDAVNGWLAARIVEGYVWPHLDLATDANRRSPFNLDNLLNQCADIFRRNEEYPTVIRNYQILLALVDSPQRQDAAHFQIAMACEQAGDPAAAIKNLRQIQRTNDYAWAFRRLPRLEQQAKSAR